MNKKVIGIAGGGQLGRMLTVAAHNLNFKVIVLDPTPNSPAGQIADLQIIGDFKDKKELLKLGKISDFITFETESVNAQALNELIKKGKKINPDPKTLSIIKDKFKQKEFLNKNKIPVSDFEIINNMEDCIKMVQIFGYPFLLKTRFDAYDGKGNFLIKNKKDIKKAFEKFKGKLLYAEKFVSFKKELSVVSARDKYGKIISFPVVETIHKNNICHTVISPAIISKKIQKDCNFLAKKVLENLKGVGVFAIEMFLTKENKLLVNEIAPRVHNSGHHTIEAFNVSQFEQHIRAITGMHLSPIRTKSNTAIMLNILGKRNGIAKPIMINKIESENAKVHIYGKIETRIERKMGHITVTGDSHKKALKEAIKLRSKISI